MSNCPAYANTHRIRISVQRTQRHPSFKYFILAFSLLLFMCIEFRTPIDKLYTNIRTSLQIVTLHGSTSRTFTAEIGLEIGHL